MAKFNFNRRKFFTTMGAAGLGLGLAACNAPGSALTPAAPMPGMSSTPASASPQQGQPAHDMDAMHEKGVKEFIAQLAQNNKIFWPPKLPFKMEGDTKVFEITCKPVTWETKTGEKVQAMSYNGVVPGPEIRVTEGDKVRVVVKNELKESTSIHWHGVHTPNKMDGVPYVTQDPIKPGATYTYEFVAKPAGSHMYHSHHNAHEQVTKGLLGAFIVDPKDKSKEPKYDSDYVMILNDTGIGLTINGRSFPGTGAITAKQGEIVRVRFMNEGDLIHPMHLHGYYMQVIAQDGALFANPYYCDVLNIAPGQRFDVLIKCDEPGVWAFHCHVLSHAESPHGMFGMVTAIVVQ
jgi:FtsP/CotA-like multicopper oxidase with cupredoxin domain